jgi:hypothetical protein
VVSLCGVGVVGGWVVVEAGSVVRKLGLKMKIVHDLLKKTEE